jgi:hypothetical protein
MIKRFILLVSTFSAVTGLFAAQALADSPHFVGTPTESVSSTGSSITLSVSFKAAGLGNISQATFFLTATAEGTFGCFTKSGNHPQATNKEGPATLTGSTTVDVRNGQTTGTVSVTLSTSLTCPPGQHLAVISASFTDITLTGPEGLHTTLPDVTFP